MSEHRTSEERDDIVDELEARGDALSLRAAKYIRLKRWRVSGLESVIKHMATSHLSEAVTHE